VYVFVTAEPSRHTRHRNRRTVSALSPTDANVPLTPLFVRSIVGLHFVSARQATGSFYRPFLLLVNGVYLALVFYLRHSSTSTSTSTATSTTATATTGIVPSKVLLSAATLAIWVVQYLCYQSILDDAALKPSSSSSSPSLAGGIALDLLAFVIVVQFAALLWSNKAYWGLLVVPLAMAWQFYKTIRAIIPPTSSSSSSSFMPTVPSTTTTHVASSATQRGHTKRR
jgi:SRP-independent targeting protein 2/TMEM208